MGTPRYSSARSRNYLRPGIRAISGYVALCSSSPGTGGLTSSSRPPQTRTFRVSTQAWSSRRRARQNGGWSTETLGRVVLSSVRHLQSPPSRIRARREGTPERQTRACSRGLGDLDVRVRFADRAGPPMGCQGVVGKIGNAGLPWAPRHRRGGGHSNSVQGDSCFARLR